MKLTVTCRTCHNIFNSSVETKIALPLFFGLETAESAHCFVFALVAFIWKRISSFLSSCNYWFGQNQINTSTTFQTCSLNVSSSFWSQRLCQISFRAQAFFGADAETDLRPQENSDIKYIGWYYVDIVLAECDYKILVTKICYILTNFTPNISKHKLHNHTMLKH